MRATCLLLVLGPLACAADGAADVARSTVRDSAGITIVESARDGWRDAAAAWTVDSAPAVEIGVVDGDAPYLLDRVAGATRLPDGRIVVADGGSNQLRFFDSTGAFLATAGREGPGPGEFRYLRALKRCGADSLFAFDINWQLKVFTADGELVREMVVHEPERPLSPYELACSPTGLFAISGWGERPQRPQLGFFSSMTEVWVLDAGGREIASLGEHVGSERLGTSGGSRPHPFGRSTALAAAREGIYLGSGERFEVRRYAHDGQLARIQRAPAEDLSIGAAMLDAYREERLARTTESNRPLVERELRDMPLPSGYPAFTSMVADAAGYLWVERFRAPGDGTRRWGVFSPDGAFLGHVLVPAELELLEVGDDYVLGVARDAEGVERVRLHTLHRRDP